MGCERVLVRSGVKGNGVRTALCRRRGLAESGQSGLGHIADEEDIPCGRALNRQEAV